MLILLSVPQEANQIWGYKIHEGLGCTVSNPIYLTRYPKKPNQHMFWSIELEILDDLFPSRLIINFINPEGIKNWMNFAQLGVEIRLVSWSVLDRRADRYVTGPSL